MIKIDIKVDKDLTYTFLEEENLIEGFSLKRQMDDDITSLTGAVECAEINCTLNNLYNDFNITSPLYQYYRLKNGLEVKVYSVAEKTNELFTGYIVDFSAPTSSEEQNCNIRAVDRLQMLLNKDTSTNIDIQIEKDITLFDYILLLFGAYGVLSDEIEIDANLKNIILDYSLLNGNKLSEQLNDICKSTDAYIYVNRNGKIIVKSKSITGTPIKTFTRTDNENYLTSTEYGKSLFHSYNSLKVGYVAAKVSEVKEVLSINGIGVPAGETYSVTFDLDSGNLYELDNIKLTSTSNTSITDISATSSTITISLYNPIEEYEDEDGDENKDGTEDDIVDIKVYGKTVETADAFIVKSLPSEEIDQEFEVSSVLIQQKSYADDLATKLYNRAVKSIPYIKASVEVQDFSVDLGYIVRIEDSEAKISYDGYIHSIDVEYDGQGYSYFDLGIKSL